MKHRQNDPVPLAAAKSGFSQATAIPGTPQFRGHNTSVDAPTDASAKFGYGHGIGCCLLSGLLMQHLTAGQYGSARDGSKSN